MALPIVMVALVVIGTLLAGAFFNSTQEYLAGRNTVEESWARIAADDALLRLIDGWELVSAIEATGASTSTTYQRHNSVTTDVTLTRLGPLVFWVEAESRSARNLASEARRKVGAVVRIETPEIALPGALTISMSAGLGPQTLADVAVTGADAAPRGWPSCSPDGPMVAGMAVSDSSAWVVEGPCPEEGCLRGDPPLREDASLRDASDRDAELDRLWSELGAAPSVSLEGGSAVGTLDQPVGPREAAGHCDRTVLTNWGDPRRASACADYFPVIRVHGDLHLAGGEGQGVLLVDGDLELSGGATFVGLVLVRGALRTIAPGATIVGAVRVWGEDGRRSTLAGGGRFGFSRCAVAMALASHGAPRIQPGTWVELHR